MFVTSRNSGLGSEQFIRYLNAGKKWRILRLCCNSKTGGNGLSCWPSVAGRLGTIGSKKGTSLLIDSTTASAAGPVLVRDFRDDRSNFVSDTEGVLPHRQGNPLAGYTDAMPARPFSIAFILGVPRSGTTLLRTILDSHPDIAAPPETPWLLGSYGSGASLRDLIDHLCSGRTGLVKNISNVDEQDVMAASRLFVAALFARFIETNNARYLVFKTPDDIQFLDWLLVLFPNAKFVHLVRDGRDVTLSTVSRYSAINWFGRATPENVMRRWCAWESKTRQRLEASNVDFLSLRYEDMVSQPDRNVGQICDFLGVDFDKRMIDYGRFDHDFPEWEAGSNDVRNKNRIDESSAFRWKQKDLRPRERRAFNRYNSALAELGYERAPMEITTREYFLECLPDDVVDLVSRGRSYLRKKLA